MTQENYKRWKELLDLEYLTQEEERELRVLNNEASASVFDSVHNTIKNKVHFVNKKALKVLASSFVLAGSLGLVATIVNNTEKKDQALREEGALLALQNQSNSKERIQEDQIDYPKAIDTILENNYTIVSSRYEGYTVVTQDGLLRWVTLDGRVFNDLKELQKESEIKYLSKEEVQNRFQYSTLLDATYDTYTVHVTKGKNNYVQEIYENSEKVGEASFALLNGNPVTIYQDTKEDIFSTNIRDFTILNDHKELVEYSKIAKEEKGKKIESYSVSVSEEDVFTFAEYYQHLFTLDEANQNAYVTPNSFQQGTMFDNNLYSINKVPKNGLLCLNEQAEVAYCAEDGTLFKDYLSCITKSATKKATIKNLADSTIALYKPNATVHYFSQNVRVDGKNISVILDTDKHSIVGQIYAVCVNDVEYPIFYDQENRTYSSSLEDFDLQRQIKEYKRTGNLPTIVEYKELEGSQK